MEADANGRTSSRLLEVRTVDIISGRGRSVTLSSVRCPDRGRASAVEECAQCGNSEGIAQDALARGEYLSCASPVPGQPGAAAEAARVADVMRNSSVALRPGVTRGVAADALRSRGVPVAPVVDGEGRPIGLASEADLLRAKSGARVADAMVKIALSVPETAPLRRAAALMAEHRTDRLAVVSDDGVVVGMLTAMDVVGWLAGALP
ncbi:MAG TPA: CBS domain-containing protein [Anaeromyxobacter sp.]